MPPVRSKSVTRGLLIALSMSFCTALASVGGLDQKDSEARQAMANADALRAEWKEASLRHAADEYDRAAIVWRSAGDLTNAARAALKSGDVYFLMSRYSEALKRYQDTQALAGTSDIVVEANALSQMARLYSSLGNNDVAQQHATKALALLNHGEATLSSTARTAYGQALIALGEVSYAKGNFKKALTLFKDAQEFLKEDPEGQARAHLFIAYITGSIGNPEKAVGEISQALDLYKATNNRRGEALALSALGKYYSLKVPDKMQAIRVQRDARHTFRAIGDRYSEAIAFNALGELYENLSDNKTAFTHYKNALKLFQDIDSLDGMTASTCNIARMHYKLDKTHDQALRHYERCLSACRIAGKHRSEANALNEIATVYAAQGKFELASKQYQRTQRIYEAIGDIRGQATALNAHGDFLLQAGKQTAALEAYSRSLPLAEQTGDQNILATTLYNLARANLKPGSPERAHYFLQRSIRIIEDQRANLETPDFRLSYFSGVQNHYELQTQILMRLNRLHPSQGFDTQAFLSSEKGRARLLRDLITESGADFRQGTPKQLIDSEREIRGLIRSLAQYRMDLSLSQEGSAELAEVDNQMTELKTQYQEVLSRLRHNPRVLSLLESASLSLEQIQTELRDSDTMILEYDLGDERSYVWAITANSLHSYELPPRKEIEDSARDIYKLITARQMSQEQLDNEPTDVKATDRPCFEKRRKLSQMILGPLAEHLGNRRLIVIAEGALQYIPFDALPSPVAQTAGPIESEKASTTLLVETNEISALPSISALIAIRRAKKQVTSTSKLIAIIADPVFSRSDDRVQSGTSSLSSALPATDHDPIETRAFARLVHASEEADAIGAKAPTGTTLVAKGFDANRETAMSSELGQYQILHFATHSFVDSEQPESSGIVLTMVDRNGVRADGLMLLHDIYNLDLSSELTVLSACQTALGKDVNGEGLVGLNHSFLSAGSKSVISSLWKVDDQATAVLMAEFYDAMFEKGMSPATALRSAKLKMMRDPRWSAPYYWAGFVLQGEYNNHIAVDRYSWLRPHLVVLFLLILSLLAAGLFVVQKRKRRFSTPPSS